MEMSTPLISPKRKKHSLVQKFFEIDETLGDIESEIQSRRQEAINKSTESRRRLSTAPLLAGYSSTQLSQHCKDVIKLSTENKINCKNAFNFWLIDVMAAMAKKTDSEINKNFQVASCTLDASVKIYGYRVDAIHTDAIKMAGGFLNKEAQPPGEEEPEKDGDDGGDGDRGEMAFAKTKTKKKRRKLTVVPPETLNAKTEAEIVLDAVPRPSFLNRKTTGNDLLVKIPKHDDGGLLVLDSDTPCWSSGGDTTVSDRIKSENFDGDALMSLLSSIQVSEEDDLCPVYSKIEFGKAPREEDSEDENFQPSQNSGTFEFDANVSVEDVGDVAEEDERPEEQRHRVHIPVGGFDSDEEISIRPEKAKARHGAAISEMKYRISVNPLEYSMFDEKTFKAWAGPAHWKVAPVRRPLEDCANKEDLSKPVGSKRTRKGKIKSRPPLFEMLEDVLEKNLTECEKTTLFKSTMLHWNPQNTTMPKDLKCQSKNLFSLYHMPSFTVTFKGDAEEGAEVSDHCDGQSEDLEYCSSSIPQGEPADDGSGGGEEDGYCDDDLPNAGDRTWNADNMVEAPNKVEKIQVSAFKRKKHVDIRYLKRGLWSVLTNREADGEIRARVEKPIEFTQLVKGYSKKVPKSFGSTLSAPLIFNALLHLTNEKSLVLTQDKANKSTFFISQ